MARLHSVVAILCLTLPVACGDDGDGDDGGGSAGSTTAGGSGGKASGGSTSKGGSTGTSGSTGKGGSTSNAGGTDSAGGSGSTPDPICEAGCETTLAADCDLGPTTQEQCVQDCQELSSGACATEYAALQGCAEGEEITCSAQGIPIIEACADEQDAFIACLN